MDHNVLMVEGKLMADDFTDMRATNLNEWTGGRSIVSIGSNSGAVTLPFQGWKRFKEAFVPELIQRAVVEHPSKVNHIVDPFGGSGTTALAAQFLNIVPSTIEVNPYLADLIEAKLHPTDASAIGPNLTVLLQEAAQLKVDAHSFFEAAPKTFVEPGQGDRWIFGSDLANEAARLISALERVEDVAIRRLFRVLIGSVLVELSNAVISGKGRRYRQGWEGKTSTGMDLRHRFISAVSVAATDIARYSGQRAASYNLFRGDSRELVQGFEPFDLAIYSPPYPNSFDYTDVYNIELWALQYLTGSESNRSLRSSTLSSHVQLMRDYKNAPDGSRLLDYTLEALERCKQKLWNKNIPQMIASYFSEMITLIVDLAKAASPGHRQWLIVGDSRYAGVDIPVAKILSELCHFRGLTVEKMEAFRSMRSAPQQGGRLDLPETLLVVS
jgi:hypothetical protein